MPMSNLFIRINLLLAAFIYLLPNSLIAQESPLETRIATSIQAEQELWMGQQITLNIDLKTNGQSFSDTLFSLPEVSGAFLLRTDSSTIKFSETINGQSWQIIRYPIAIYPQISGQLNMPKITVRFKSTKGFGYPNEVFELSTEPMELMIKLPPGVNKGEMVVSTADFKLDYQWQPETTEAQAGAAFTLSVTRRAANIAAMLLPPLPVYEQAGLAAYPQPPEVIDKSNRGELIGERHDRIIWVAESPGKYNIPDISFQWFDPASGELKQQVIAGIELNISAASGGPDKLNSDTVGSSSFKSRLMVLLIALGFIWWWFKPHKYFLDKLQADKTSEASAYKKLIASCRSNQAAEAYLALQAWLGYYADAFSQADLVSEAELLKELSIQQEAIVQADNNWQGGDLLKLLPGFRRRLKQRKAVQSSPDLPTLNP